MTEFGRRSIGLVGQVAAILLLAIVIEFGAITLLYERASQFAVREGEAHRLAEHLVVSRRIVGDMPPAARRVLADELTTDRYIVRWRPHAAPPPPITKGLSPMQRQMLRWEPALADTDLRLALSSPGRSAIVTGGLMLPDNSWLEFSTRQPITNLNLSGPRIALALVPALLVMAFGGMLIQHTLTPLRRLAQAANSFDGDDNIVLPEQGPIEVRRVTRAFNDLQARVRALVTERTLALAAVSHDLRTPLARLSLRADAVGDPATRTAIRRDVTEMTAMVSSLLAFLGGDEDSEPSTLVDVAVLLATVADSHEDMGNHVRYAGPDHAEMFTRPVELRRAVNNLVDNAIRYGQQVHVGLAVADGNAIITVDDDGPGIPEAMLARVTEPFVRLDDARARTSMGFGLGLSIVVRSAALLGGTLTLSNRTTGGLRATLSLRAAKPQA